MFQFVLHIYLDQFPLVQTRICNTNFHQRPNLQTTMHCKIQKKIRWANISVHFYNRNSMQEFKSNMNCTKYGVKFFCLNLYKQPWNDDSVIMVQLNKYETAPNSNQISQNLTSDCLLISLFLPVLHGVIVKLFCTSKQKLEPPHVY